MNIGIGKAVSLAASSLTIGGMTMSLDTMYSHDPEPLPEPIEMSGTFSFKVELDDSHDFWEYLKDHQLNELDAERLLERFLDLRRQGYVIKLDEDGFYLTEGDNDDDNG